jgi:hypothetical protein
LENKKIKEVCQKGWDALPIFLMASIHINFLQKIYIVVLYTDGCELKVDNWR